MNHIAIYPGDEARKLVKSYLANQEWWVIVAHNKLSAEVMESIEGAYYAGEANADFHLSVLSWLPMLRFGVCS